MNYIFALICPFLNEATDSSLVKINVFRSKEIIKGTLPLPLPQFPRFYLGGTTAVTGRGGNRMGLLTLVKEGIVFQRAAEDYCPPLERLAIEIQLSRRRWAMIQNL